jgi:DNA-binding response OmpR family regulator
MNKTKILLVEDDPNFGAVLKNYLELNDYDVKLCPDGFTGYDEFAKGKYDICILDVMMPRKDGFTLAKEIREKDENIPIIFLTAKTMKDDMLKGFNVGADDYITKPFDSEVLLVKLKAILRRSGDKVSSSLQKEFDLGKYHFNYDHRTIDMGNGFHRKRRIFCACSVCIKMSYCRARKHFAKSGAMTIISMRVAWMCLSPSCANT